MRRPCETVAAALDMCVEVVLGVARGSNCPFLSNWCLKDKEDNFLRAQPQLHVNYVVSSSGEVYCLTDIDDMLPESLESATVAAPHAKCKLKLPKLEEGTGLSGSGLMTCSS